MDSDGAAHVEIAKSRFSKIVSNPGGGMHAHGDPVRAERGEENGRLASLDGQGVAPDGGPARLDKR